jgi:photosystem II stability/assembly factor-like uncharacterized protein
MSSLALHCHTMRHPVFQSVGLLTLALATGSGEPLSPHPLRARHTDRGAGAAAHGGTRRTKGPDLVDAATGELRYRMIGPHRGGRTKAAAGIADQPNVFYIGVVNGGVWKTTDYGRTWTPIFDDQPTGSIGAIAVAPSNPDIIYVGSGEGLQRPDLSVGNGIYKSRDGGRTWAHLGLRDGQQIPQIAVDPRSPDRLFVAVLGHPYGASEERGVFRSTDGGATFHRVLFRDPDTGAIDVILDPSNPDTVYAALWEARQGPWENGAFSGPGSGLYKSTDGGTSWRQLTNGLPTFEADGLGRIGIGIAPSRPQRLFLTVDAQRNGGLYRSDDGGEQWALVNADPRVTSRGSDFAEVKVHPTNSDVVFTASIVAWKSVDGGQSFKAFRGAPGGDDYHRIWINPKTPDVMLMAADQGAVVTVNGGETWSSWYNQPTAQFYHVIADNAFPYRVCGGQQESGSACVASRSDDGRITFRDWRPVGVEEYGYVAPDPLNPDIVYGGKLTRFDRRTGQVQNIAPSLLRGSDYRVVRTMPVLFSPVDAKTLYFASNVVWKTEDGGQQWTQISPDLTRETWEAPANVGKYRGTTAASASRRGVIYTIAPSPMDVNRVWAGTDDGLIHFTSDAGKTWADVTPPALGPWAKVSLMEASRFRRDTAFAAVNTLRLDDLRPHIYRTRDAGRTWTRIVHGIPDGTIVNAVREDPKRPGLLFAGTEEAVFVSLDEGDSWQSLRLNMPATSIRDLVIKDDDLVVGTHGRSFWILDDITPLRQVDARVLAAEAFLYEPQQATRVRWSMNTDTPLPPDEPAGQNPPDGAVINYWLKSAADAVTLEITDAAGAIVRRYSSRDPMPPVTDEGNVPAYWIRPPVAPAKTAGMHRFVWDLRYPPPAVDSVSFPIAAVPGDTPRRPSGPWALPGRYTVTLVAGGVRTSKSLVVRMDPRVNTRGDGLEEQFRLSMQLNDALPRVQRGLARAGAADASSPAAAPEPMRQLHADLLLTYEALQEVDVAPTAALGRTVADLLKRVDGCCPQVSTR